MDEELYHLLELNKTARSFAYNDGLYSVHQITGTNLYLVHIEGWSQTNAYPDDCPYDSACPSVRSPGCIIDITDNYGSCISVVTDVCEETDTPAFQSGHCVWANLDKNAMCNLEKGVQSDFCASDFEEDCDSHDAAAVVGHSVLSLLTAAALVLSMG